MPAPIKWSAADFELVNAENPEGEPWLAASPDGRFTLNFFESFAGPPPYTDIETRLYRADGADTGLGPATTFSATTIEHQAASAYLPDGRQVFVWTEEPAAGGGNLEDVYASVYVGNLVSVPRFLVAGGAGIQHDPVVAASANGGFAIALADDSVAGGRVTLKFYNAVGTLIITVLDASAPEGVFTPGGSEGDFREVEITALANGNYVVAWRTEANYDVVARIYSPSGVAQTGLIDIDPAGSVQQFPDVTALADGRFLVTYGLVTAGNVTGRIFAADGTSSSGLFTITTDGAPGGQSAQSAALHDGRFVTVWRDATGNIEGQVMFADGTPDGAAFAVNSDAAGDKARPTVATLADGRFAVSWESGAGATATIFTTIFDPREQRIAQSASSLNDDWYGTVFSDTMFMGAGNDLAHGGGTSDFIYGEAGNDTLFGEDGDDRINGGNGVDTMRGGVGNDIYWANSTSDVTIEAAGEGVDTVRSTVSWSLAADVEKIYLEGTAQNGTGNALSNHIHGNNAANVIDGDAGADRLFGYLGNDTYIVDSNGDLIFETTAGAAGGIDAVEASVNHTLANNVENLTLTGAANINGTGNTIANAITGNGATNFIDGKLGADTLTGGSGNDHFLFSTALGASNIDTISDYSVPNDTIRLDDAIFTGLTPLAFLTASQFTTGPAATTAAHRIVYDSATGALLFDADGSGAGAAKQFATLAAGLALTASDFYVF